MIDTHCHLNNAEYSDAALDGLRAAIAIGMDTDGNRETIKIAQQDPLVFAAIGVHPGNADLAAQAATRNFIENHVHEPRVVALGETGFDSYRLWHPLSVQEYAYDWHAELAASENLPLIMHIRHREGQTGDENASDIARKKLEAYEGNRVILHCFNGDNGLLDLAVERGFYVSFAGNLTYKNAHELHEAAKRVPAAQLLVETDAPYLSPVPHRGKPNIPAWVRYTAAFLANIRGANTQAFEAVLDANAIRAFALPLDSEA